MKEWFKKTSVADAGQALEPGPHLLMDRGLLARWFVMYRLSQEMKRAGRYGRPLSIMCAAPYLLPAEELNPEQLYAAAASARKISRSTDVVGWLDAGALLVVMPEAEPKEAEVAAWRWSSELFIRTRSVGVQKWSIGTAAYSRGIDSPKAFVAACEMRPLYEASPGLAHVG